MTNVYLILLMALRPRIFSHEHTHFKIILVPTHYTFGHHMLYVAIAQQLTLTLA
jgi:hypothetical protein